MRKRAFWADRQARPQSAGRERTLLLHSAAEDGPSGLSILEQTPAIDLVLSDVVLPNGMSGPKLAEQARLSFPKLKFVFMSGYADNVTRADGSIPQNIDILNKPFAKQELASKIRMELDGAGRLLDPSQAADEGARAS